MRPADRVFFERPVAEVARDLIGVTLLVDGIGGPIVETEAYDETDPASHSRSGPTKRNASMFGPAGRAYIYRSYGLHWCLNVVCGPEGDGRAVLIRAIAPLHGIETMKARRGSSDLHRLCAGPGRLCQALDVTGHFDGFDLEAPPFDLRFPGAVADQARPRPAVTAGTRIGISRGVDAPWRFGATGSPFLSRPMPPAPLSPRGRDRPGQSSDNQPNRLSPRDRR